MASSLESLPSFCSLNRLSPRRKLGLSSRAKAQSSSDEGKSSISIVDANLGVLKERMEMVRMEERVRKWCSGGEGWYYQSGYNCELKRDTKLAECLGVAVLVVGTTGLTILGGTLCLYLISFVAHLG